MGQYGPGCSIDRGGSSWGDLGNFIYEVSGVADLAECIGGSGSACGWAALGVLPLGKAVRFAKLGVDSAKQARNAQRLIEAAYGQNASSTTLRRNMGAVGAGGYAHHIVAWGDERAALSKSILLAHGIGPNQAINGVLIKKAGNHPAAYYKAVENRLERALERVEGQGWFAARNALKKELRTIARDINKGKLQT